MQSLLNHMDIPQIVTSQQCLSCRGCCFFHDPRSDWSPRLMPDDVMALLQAVPEPSWRCGSDGIMLRPCREAYGCSFLDEGTHHCRVYPSRPFECRLYPFLLSREKNGFKVYAHLSCPAVDEFRQSGQWEAHKAAVREFFGRTEVWSFIRQNAAGLPDYSRFSNEIEEVCSFDPAEDLLAQRSAIEAALASQARALSSLAFVNMFAWQDFFRFDIEKIGGALCVFAVQPAGVFLYWPPIGAGMTPGVIDACFERMALLNRGGSLTRIENVAQDELKFFDEHKYRFEWRGHEYVYDRAGIAALRGNDYRSRRGEVNAFERLYAGAYVFRPYVADDLNACAILFDRWLDARVKKHDNDIYRHMLAENRGVHRLILAYADRLGLVGRVVEVDGRVVAYTFGYPLGRDIFCVLVEVADLGVKGLPAFVFSRFCGDEALAPFRWINAMDDFAADDLARAKMSWRPVKLEPVYTVVPRGKA